MGESEAQSYVRLSLSWHSSTMVETACGGGWRPRERSFCYVWLQPCGSRIIHTVGTLYTPSHGWHIIYTITQFTHYSHGHTVHALYTPSRGSHIIHTVMLGLLCLGNTWTFMLGKYLDFALCDNRPHSWYKTKSVLSFLKNKKTKINV
jgi:hypothetical protein